MIEYFIYFILSTSLIIIASTFGVFVYTSYVDFKNPPSPIHYVWRTVWPDYKGDWERGRATEVYIDRDTNEIRGKVVCQTDGLYLATMWNGASKEFIMNYEASKWVEQYKLRVYK